MMPRARLFLMIAFFGFFAAGKSGAAVHEPVRKLWMGESFVYEIRYLGIPVGRAEAGIPEILHVQGRPAYHIVVKVRSYFVMDLLYKVRDEHHSYLDVEKLHSLGYKKNVREGFHRMKAAMDYDQARHRVLLSDGEGGRKKEMPIPENVQDEVSSGYWFRTLPLKPDTSLFIPVHAGEKNWKMEVKLYGPVRIKIPQIGEFEALEVEPLMEFQGIFVKRGRIRGWISLDNRRIPLRMKVKIPVLGSVVAELIEYRPGK